MTWDDGRCPLCGEYVGLHDMESMASHLLAKHSGSNRESQGRGSYNYEGRIEQAAKYAHENWGWDDDGIMSGAKKFFDSVSSEIIQDIRQAMRRLFD